MNLKDPFTGRPVPVERLPEYMNTFLTTGAHLANALPDVPFQATLEQFNISLKLIG